MLLAVLYLIAWVYIAVKYLVPLHNKWEEKVEPVIQSLESELVHNQF